MKSTSSLLSYLEHGLRGHPDRAFVDYVVNGIKEGFRIRFNRSCPLKSACSNLPTPQGSLVQDYLSREVSLSRMVTWTSPNMDQLHISPLELISKRHKPGVAADSGSVLPQGEKRQRQNQPGVGVSTVHTHRPSRVTDAACWERVSVGKSGHQGGLPQHPSPSR